VAVTQAQHGTDTHSDSPATVVRRTTRQRTAVVEAISGLDSFLSAQEVHQRIQQSGDKVGLATVYRALQSLADAGEVDVLMSADGEARYRSCGQGRGHHHHLVCRSCGLTVEVEGPAVERWTASVAREHGFVDVSHTLDVFGLCPSCAAAAP
jgi:Fur family ferric uptake transcriptional regulator